MTIILITFLKHKSHELYVGNPPLTDLNAWTEVINRMKLVQSNLIECVTEFRIKKSFKEKFVSHRSAMIQLENDIVKDQQLMINPKNVLAMEKLQLDFVVGPQEYRTTEHTGYDPMYQSVLSFGNPSLLSVEINSLIVNEGCVTILGDRNYEVSLPIASSNPSTHFTVIPDTKEVHYDQDWIISKVDRKSLLGLDKILNIVLVNENHSESNRLTIPKTYRNLFKVVHNQSFTVVVIPKIINLIEDYIEIGQSQTILQ